MAAPLFTDPLRRGRGVDFGLVPLLRDLVTAAGAARRGSRAALLRGLLDLHLRSTPDPRRLRARVQLDVLWRGHPVRIELRDNPSDFYTLAEILLRGAYADLLDHHPEPPSLFVDLGAHVGLTSLLYSVTHPGATVVCVEPSAESAGVLRRNMEHNGMSWTVLPCAVAGEAGTRELHCSEWWSSVTIVPCVAEARMGSPRRVEHRLRLPRRRVETTTLDAILARGGGGGRSVVKMDVEGAEAEIIRPGAPWLDRVGMLVVDIHEKYVRPAPILEALSSAGFTCTSPPGSRTRTFVATR